jgi:uncharacterized membrane protein
MRSKAAIGNHPLHPALVPLPIGAFFVAFVADLVYAVAADPVWYQIAFYSMLIGVASALLAAAVGFVDYVGVRMSTAGRQVATMHMVLNLAVVLLYLISLWFRWDGGALAGARWGWAFLIQLGAFAALGVSGWLGGQLTYEHKVGVVEHADEEATAIGRAEPVRKPASSPARGL